MRLWAWRSGRHAAQVVKGLSVDFRERVWYFIVSFALTLAGTIIYTYNATEIFESTATIEILRDDLNPLGQFGDQNLNEIRSTEGLNTQIGRLQSLSVINQVNNRLTVQEQRSIYGPIQAG